MSPAATFEWTGASGDDLWATAGNWNPSGVPDTADAVIFDDTDPVGDAFTVNNIVGANKTIAALSYTNSVSGTWHVTQIPSGITLTVSGNVIVGGGNAVGLSTSATMTGGGNFLATGSSFALGNTAPSGIATPGNLDLSGLTTFVYTATNGTMGIGRLATGTGSRSSGNLTLAAGSNNITAATIDMNGATGTEVFKLFDAAPGGYSGDFASYDLPIFTWPWLAWDYSSLPVDGTLRITGGIETPPQMGAITRASDGNFQLTGTGPGTAPYRILATTNVALPLSNWVSITSGNFIGGAFTFTDTNATNFTQRFYSVVTP